MISLSIGASKPRLKALLLFNVTMEKCNSNISDQMKIGQCHI